MSRSAASTAVERPTSGRPAAATPSGFETFASAMRRPLSSIASSMNSGDDPPRQLVRHPGLLESRIELVDLVEEFSGEGRRFTELGEAEEAGPEAVVDVVRAIGDVVGDGRRLRLEARMQAEVERLQAVVSRDGGGTPRRR